MATSNSNECGIDGKISPTFCVYTDVSNDVDFSVNLTLPKFTRDCDESDFLAALRSKIDIDEIKFLGKRKHSNEWQVTLTSTGARDTLLQMGIFTVKNKKCVVSPCKANQITGRVHWLPVDVPDDVIQNILLNFGEVLKFSKEKISSDNEIRRLTRFFIMNLSPDCTPDDIPHFISVNQNQGMITVKGRNPRCFKCGEVGHRKSKCPKQGTASKKHAKNKSLEDSKGKKIVRPNEKSNSKVSSNNVEPANSSKNKEKEAKLSSVSNSGVIKSIENPRASQSSKENTHNVATEVKHLQDLMTLFSQKMNEILTDVGCTLNGNKTSENQLQPTEEAIASSSASNSNVGNNKQVKKKKKKKSKTSDNYELASAEMVSNDNLSSGQHSPKGSLDSGIAINGHSRSTNTTFSMTENDWIEPPNATPDCVKPDSTVISNQKRKKKNKKKSNTSAIPGLTLP